MRHALRLITLLAASMAFFAACDKSSAKLEDLEARFDSLSERVAAIENTQLKALESQIASIQKEIAELQNADKVQTEDVSALEGKMSVISDDLAQLKESVSSLNGTDDELSGKISSINTKLSELEEQITSILASIAELKAKVDAAGGSVTLSYIPKYADNNEPVQYTRDALEISGTATLNFTVQPSSAAETIAKDWKSTLSTIAVYTLTKAAGGESVELAVTGASANDGILSVTVAVDKLGKDFIFGDIGAALAVKVSCGDIQIVTDYINLFPVMDGFIDYLLWNFDTDGDGQVNDMDKVTSLDVSGYGLTTIDDILFQMPALESLNCRNNELTSIDLSKNPALITLDCRSNKLTSLDLSKNPKLTEVNLKENNLASLVIVNTALKMLDCSGLGLTSLIVSNNVSLTHVDCSNNALTNIDLSKNESLTSVDMCGNANLTKVVCKSLGWILANDVYTDAAALFYNSDGTQITWDTSLTTEIDGIIWEQFNAGTRLGNKYGDEYTLDDAQSACPSGWRVPTKEELQSLSANYSKWKTYLGMEGRWFSGSRTYSSTAPAIFLPVYSSNSSFGDYWSSTEDNDGLTYYLWIDSREVSYGGAAREYKMSVRCLKD
jgi:uncharacterized protein YoxC